MTENVSVSLIDFVNYINDYKIKYIYTSIYYNFFYFTITENNIPLIIKTNYYFDKLNRIKIPTDEFFKLMGKYMREEKILKLKSKWKKN